MTMTANSQVPVQRARRAALLNYFSLFSSFSTLICCALPSVLVLLGMGTTVASLLSAAPWLVSGRTDCDELRDDLSHRSSPADRGNLRSRRPYDLR
jgi:hypothetical protein